MTSIVIVSQNIISYLSVSDVIILEEHLDGSFTQINTPLTQEVIKAEDILISLSII